MAVDNVYYEGRIKVPYSWHAGETLSRFFVSLRDKQEIWGTRCPECRTVFVPPVKTCWKCFVPTGEWVQVSDTGTVTSFTVAHYFHQAMPRKSPVIYALIKLDGADGSLLHFLGDVDPGALAVGMPVKAVFSRERTGTILDIEYFSPV